MSPIDYLLLRTPETRMAGKKRSATGSISGARIGFSLLGILLGIVLSFYVSGLRSATSSNETPSRPAEVSNTNSRASSATSSPHPAPTISEPTVSDDLSWRRFLKVGLISLVICGISYQGLYFSLRLYQNEPAWLILFISFQYGYFWQSLVNAVA